MSSAVLLAEIVERNGRCFEINQEGGFVREVDCANPTSDLLVVIFVVGLIALWWFGYGPGARRRESEKNQREDRIRRDALEQAGILTPQAEERTTAAPVPPMTSGQRVLHFMSAYRQLFEKDSARVVSRLHAWMDNGVLNERALAEASTMLERYPIPDAPYLAKQWTQTEALAAKNIIDQVRRENH